MLPVGTVLLTTRATIGDASIALKECCTNQGFQSLVAKNDNDNEFLYYLIQTKRKELKTKANGSTFIEISNQEVRNINVMVPDSKTQTKIAGFLSLLDKRIETQNKIIEELNVLRNSIIDNFYRKKTNGSYKPVSGMINEFNKKTTQNNEYEVLSSTANGIYKQSEYFNKEAASADTTGYKILPFGYCTYRSMSDTGEFHFNQQLLISKGIVSPAYPVFAIIEKHSKYVLVSLNDSPTVKKQILADKSGGTRFALPLSRLRKILIPWADDKDILYFEELVSKIDSKLTTEKHIASKLLEQKNYLLANLFI